MASRKLLLVVGLALVARIASAWWGYGFHARDDYYHLMEPALHFAVDPDFDWDRSELSGAGIRSHLGPRVLARVLRALPEDSSPQTQLRALHLVLAFWACLGVVGVTLAAAAWKGPRAALYVGLFAAIHPLFIYAGTRLLLEGMAMVPLAWGVFFILRSRTLESSVEKGAPQDMDLVWAGLCMGLALWLRYQILPFPFVIGVGILWTSRHRWADWVRRGSLYLWSFLAMVGLEGLFDLWSTGRFLGPMWNNILVNRCAASGAADSGTCLEALGLGLRVNPKLSVAGPEGYLLLILVLTLPPATIWLWPQLKKSAREQGWVIAAIAAFLGLHLAVPHKEERFLFPVLGVLVLWVGVAAWRKGWEPGSAAGKVWWGIHIAASILLLTGGPQRQLMDTLPLLNTKSIVSFGPEVPRAFVGSEPGGRDIAIWRRPRPDQSPGSLEGGGPIEVLSYAPDSADAVSRMQESRWSCTFAFAQPGWWLDRLVYAVNPGSNRRRAPLEVHRCRRRPKANPDPAATDSQ